MLARHSQRWARLSGLDPRAIPSTFAPQLPKGPAPADAVLEGVQRILNIFEINGYMLLA